MTTTWAKVPGRAGGFEPVFPALTPTRTLAGTRCACGGTTGPGGECAQCRAKRLAAERSPAAPSSGFRLDVGRLPLESRTASAEERPHARASVRGAYLSEEGEPADSAPKAAQATPAPAPEVFPPSPLAPAVPAAPAGGKCTYKITYANLKTLGCPTGKCGAKIKYDITKVTASGSGCPPKLEGLKLTETVSTDEGCTKGAVKTGAGCPIGPGGALTGCTDTYWLCESPAAYPADGCVERYTQKLFIGGEHAETHTITFTITKAAGSCSGTVTRS